jgi:invasion protein IalB
MTLTLHGKPSRPAFPQGCLGPVSFPTVSTNAIKKRHEPCLNVQFNGGRTAADVKVSLKGFTPGMNRSADLMK